MNISSKPCAIDVEIHGNFVDGREVEAGSGEMLDVRNPATGDVIARIPNSTADDIDRAMKSARAPLKARRGAAWTSRTRRGWSIASPTPSRPIWIRCTGWRR
jgi:hypothetical protein